MSLTGFEVALQFTQHCTDQFVQLACTAGKCSLCRRPQNMEGRRTDRFWCCTYLCALSSL